MARPQEHPSHGQVHRAGAGQVQKLLARLGSRFPLMVCDASFPGRITRLRFRRFQVCAKDLRALPEHPEPALSWHSGFRGGAHARPKTTAVHHAARRRGGRVATRGAGATTSEGSTIGFLGAATPSAWREWVAAFVQRLHVLGWIEGRNVAIEYRWAEGREERYAAIADEFVRLKVNVIVTSGAAVVAAKQATSAIPIVFGVANDPLTTGLVASLAHPGGNVTGLSLLAPELVGKRVELLREVIPNLRRVAFMGNVDYPASVLEMREAQITAHTLGLEFAALEIKRVVEIVPAIEAMSSRA